MCVLGKAWKRMVTKACYVGEGFTRKPPKYERFIRPMVSIQIFWWGFVDRLRVVFCAQIYIV